MSFVHKIPFLKPSGILIFCVLLLWGIKFVRPGNNDSGENLFNGASLDGWEVTDFDGHGRVFVSDSAIVLEKGAKCTGIRRLEDFPKTDYEVTLEAKRVDGYDFFCGMTFPVKDEFCSLIVGGWGGTVVGLSSIDGLDASENFTGKMKRFREDEWYRILLRVTETKIEAYINNVSVVDFDLGEHKLSVRSEVRPSRPFGIATWKTTGALRRIKLQKTD
ncbi:DUF1080 domain-containing protein [candidate division KSB1 bacterium]|nr:DUF1080 domain-containing protein [candidate division KSB1 bacterium]